MRVLFLTHRLPYAPNRGDRIRAYYLLREMSRFASVSLFSLVHDHEEIAQIGHTPFADQVVVARVHRFRNLARALLTLPTRQPLTHALLDAADATASLRRLTAGSRPDVVLAFCSGMARFALEEPLLQFPFVLDMVDVDSAKWRQLARHTVGPKRWIYRREAATLAAFEAAAARRARTTLVVNDRELSELARVAPGSAAEVVQQGVDLEAYKPSDGPSVAPTVVFCGMMDYAPNEAGVRWFAEAVWPHVRRIRSDARFVIVGAAATRAIRNLAVRDPSIEVTGRVAAVQPYLWRSAVSVAPLQLARGLQNKVLEALAAGLPVVITPAVAEGLPNEVHAGCSIAHDPAQFAAEIIRLLAMSPTERRGRAAAARLEMSSWTECLKPLEGILRQAADRRRD